MDNQMTISDYAKWRSISESTVRRWIKAGKVSAQQKGGRWLVNVTMQADRQSEQVEQSPALVVQLQSENEHLRRQVDHLTQVVAMQTQQQGDLVKRLESPQMKDRSFIKRSPVAAWVRLKLQAWGLGKAVASD